MVAAQELVFGSLALEPDKPFNTVARKTGSGLTAASAMKHLTIAGPWAGLGLAVLNLALMFGGLGLVFTNGSLVMTVSMLVGAITALAALSDGVLRKAVWIAILLNVLVLLLYLYNGLMVLIAFDGSMPITTLISTIGIVPVAITLAALSKLDE